MSNGQTIIQYGSGVTSTGTVLLYRCQTSTIQQRPVFDSARTVMYWKFTISGIGYLHGFPTACKYAEAVNQTLSSSSSSSSAGVSTPTSASQADQQIRWRLKERQQFIMALGCSSTTVSSGRKLFEVNPMNAVTSPRDGLPIGLTGYDVDDGPRCLQFDVVHISADNIYKVAFTFEINVVYCDDNSTAANNTNGVLSNRWAVSDAWDHNRRTIRTYNGILELATSQFSPHWFRYLVVPPLQPGMRRDYGQFTATEDGKHLQWSITDTEIAIACPAPATRWAIEHTETSLAQDLKVASSCTVSLEGQTDCDVGQLIVLGIYAVYAKLIGVPPGQIAKRLDKNGNLVDDVIMMNDISITELVGDECKVSVSGSCWRIADQVSGFATRPGAFNKTIEQVDLPPFSTQYNKLNSTDGRVGEFTQVEGPTQLAGIFRCYLQNNCSSVAGIAGAQAGDLNLAADSSPKEPTALRIVPTLENTLISYYSVSQETSMYTHSQVESVYKTRSQRVGLPIARGPSSGTYDLRDSIAVGKLSPDICYRIVRMDVTRAGAQPELPNGETMDGGYATAYASGLPQIQQSLLKSNLLGQTESISANGVKLYHAKWEGVYVLLRSPTPNELRNLGQNKWQSGNGTVSTPTLTNSPYP